MMDISIEDRAISYAKTIAAKWRLEVGGWREILASVYFGVAEAQSKGIIDKRMYLYAYSRAIDSMRAEKTVDNRENRKKCKPFQLTISGQESESGRLQLFYDTKHNHRDSLLAVWCETTNIRKFLPMRWRLYAYLYFVELIEATEIATICKCSYSRVSSLIKMFVKSINDEVDLRTCSINNTGSRKH